MYDAGNPKPVLCDNLEWWEIGREVGGFKIALAIRDFLYFHTNCEIFCSSSVKNAIGNLIGITLNL